MLVVHSRSLRLFGEVEVGFAHADVFVGVALLILFAEHICLDAALEKHDDVASAKEEVAEWVAFFYFGADLDCVFKIARADLRHSYRKDCNEAVVFCVDYYTVSGFNHLPARDVIA